MTSHFVVMGRMSVHGLSTGRSLVSMNTLLNFELGLLDSDTALIFTNFTNNKINFHRMTSIGLTMCYKFLAAIIFVLNTQSEHE